MKEEVNQLIVNNYANHVLHSQVDREWTAEEHEGMNAALRSYGWTDHTPEPEEKEKQKRNFSIHTYVDPNTFSPLMKVALQTADGPRELDIGWTLETTQDFKFWEAFDPGIDMAAEFRKSWKDTMIKILPDITDEEFEDLWKLTPFK